MIYLDKVLDIKESANNVEQQSIGNQNCIK